MRIISGKYRNREIPTLKDSNYRPSTTKFREALFSILSSGEFNDSGAIIGSKVLDLFSGTGALAFEALSRGADSVVLIDNEMKHLNLAMEFAKKIGAGSVAKGLLMNATNLSYSPYRYNLVFMDPPYYNNYVIKSLKSLIAGNWLENSAIIAIEMEAKEDLELPSNLSLVKDKIYGNSKLLILRYEQN